MSMAAGEYVSVGSQVDSETADLARERRALRERPSKEKKRARSHLRRARCEADAGRAGRKSTHGQGRARRPRARRTRLNEDAQPEPDQPPRIGSAAAFSVGAAAPTLTAFLAPQGRSLDSCPRRVGISGRARRARRLGGRRAGGEAGAQGRLLGRAGHGGDGRDRRADRQGRLALPTRARVSPPFLPDAETDAAAPRRRTPA